MKKKKKELWFEKQIQDIKYFYKNYQLYSLENSSNQRKWEANVNHVKANFIELFFIKKDATDINDRQQHREKNKQIKHCYITYSGG